MMLTLRTRGGGTSGLAIASTATPRVAWAGGGLGDGATPGAEGPPCSVPACGDYNAPMGDGDWLRTPSNVGMATMAVLALALALAGGSGCQGAPQAPDSSTDDADDDRGHGAPCQRESETCNLLDDDCDGLIDEGFALGEPCHVGQGACRGTGLRVCGGDGLAAVCSEIAGIPRPEGCNGVDDDCDGAVDEEFAVGEPCRVGVGACARVGTRRCEAAGARAVCDSTPGMPMPEICDGMDNDCDVDVDEEFRVGADCEVGTGRCHAVGVTVCDTGGDGTACHADDRLEARPERCDGLDDDCDGQVDEAFSELGQRCSTGVGDCRAEGLLVCDAGGDRLVCEVAARPPSEETCNQRDDDCDGETDEGAVGVGVPCDDGAVDEEVIPPLARRQEGVCAG